MHSPENAIERLVSVKIQLMDKLMFIDIMQHIFPISIILARFTPSPIMINQLIVVFAINPLNAVTASLVVLIDKNILKVLPANLASLFLD